jgi:hypothetical protein
MNAAPVALFVYKRPEHTRNALLALSSNKLAEHTDLYIFADGPKSEMDRYAVAEVRACVKKVAGFRSVHIAERSENLGLSRSIIDGVGQLCELHGRVIVVEDDLVVSRHFLAYMNSGLDLYDDERSVISIHGYVYPIMEKLPESFFLKGADCWGWATWKRGWDIFEPDGARLLSELKARGLGREFDFDGTYPYTKMLQNQVQGKNDSWAIRWYASAFLRNMLTLYPGRTLVRNMGNDGSGTHCVPTDIFGDQAFLTTRMRLKRIAVEECAEARKCFEGFFRSIAPTWQQRFRRWASRLTQS